MKPEAMETWLTATQLQRSRTARSVSVRPQSAEGAIRDHRVPSKIDLGKIKPWHERLVDFLLMNPHAKAKDISAAFGVTVPWLSTMMKTDAFKAYYRSRVADHQELLSHQVINKVQSVANKALDKMAEKLDKQDLPMAEVRQTADMAIKALGYGSTGKGGPSVQVNVSPTQTNSVSVMAVPARVLEEARAGMARQRTVNTDNIKNTGNEYLRVTASMQIDAESVNDDSHGIEDAVVVPSGGASSEAEGE